MSYINGKKITLTPRLTIVEGGLKLVHQTTLEEAVQKIAITKNAEGQPFELTKMLLVARLKINAASVSATNISVRVTTDSEKRYLAYREVAKYEEMLVVLDADYIGGITRGNLAATGHPAGETLPGSRYLVAYPAVSDLIQEPIKNITVGIYSGGWLPLGAGSTVEVWGC